MVHTYCRLKTSQRKISLSAFKDDLEDDDEAEESMDNVSRVNKQLQIDAKKRLVLVMLYRSMFVNVYNHLCRLDEVNRIAQVSQQEDPNIFDFDGTYDLFKKKEEEKPSLLSANSKEAPKSRYVQNLKATAAGRNVIILRIRFVLLHFIPQSGKKSVTEFTRRNY